MFSYQARVRLQTTHADAGQTIDAPNGRRQMQTLRKLPMQAPTTAAARI